MSKKEQSNPEFSKTSNVVNLEEYRAEREEIIRRQEVREILKQMYKEANRIDAPILDETERCLDEWEQGETV